MARSAGKPRRGEKAAAVRKIFEENPKVKAREVVEMLAGQGMSISRNQVYIVRNQMKRRGRKAKRAAAVEAGRGAGMGDPVAAVLKVRALGVELGGMRHLKKLVDLLAE